MILVNFITTPTITNIAAIVVVILNVSWKPHIIGVPCLFINDLKILTKSDSFPLHLGMSCVLKPTPYPSLAGVGGWQVFSICLLVFNHCNLVVQVGYLIPLQVP